MSAARLPADEDDFVEILGLEVGVGKGAQAMGAGALDDGARDSLQHFTVDGAGGRFRADHERAYCRSDRLGRFERARKIESQNVFARNARAAGVGASVVAEAGFADSRRAERRIGSGRNS